MGEDDDDDDDNDDEEGRRGNPCRQTSVVEGGSNRCSRFSIVNPRKIKLVAMRFETDEEQPAEVDNEKKNIYNPTIPYYLKKYQLKELEVIGLLVGARGTATLFTKDVFKRFGIPTSIIPIVTLAALKGSIALLKNHLYSKSKGPVVDGGFDVKQHRICPIFRNGDDDEGKLWKGGMARENEDSRKTLTVIQLRHHRDLNSSPLSSTGESKKEVILPSSSFTGSMLNTVCWEVLFVHVISDTVGCVHIGDTLGQVKWKRLRVQACLEACSGSVVTLDASNRFHFQPSCRNGFLG
ncbi:hypothetical protein ANN_21003 [Periplaneta americana]|uniref:Uncharacterized protein n=1 Tax=Periplaneta americana TaxID=6978 RepID=A0ABQ8SE58_PERAM|nr:hypothetical protein ANN_21003 [Periplaneta americana]